MHRFPPSALAVTCILVAASAVSAASLPIDIDGRFDDWTPGAQVATDPAGDAGSGGADFRTLWMADDADWLYIRFDTTLEVQPDEGQNIVLAVDGDGNTGTGQPYQGIGAELVWNLGTRSGNVYLGGGSASVGHADLGLSIGPTVSGTEFELALDRHATPNGSPLFSGGVVNVVLRDLDSGDVFTHPGYVIDGGTRTVTSIGLGRENAAHVRVAGYNVENDGLFSGGSRGAALDRMFDAVDPDVWVICEVWSHSAAQVAAQVEAFLPSGPGENWSAVRLDGGNAIVSRFPILQSWLIYPGNRLTAALLDLRPAIDSDLLVIANHWSCCTADASRRRQADALVSFIRDARTPGGVIDLADGTPIVACGDFNLVGWRDQLVTTITGDITDNAAWGPDSPPDWDGSDFDEADPRHPDARFGYTWRSDTSTFYPGKLDWMFYTGSVWELRNHFILETRTMTATSLAAAGLLAGDTRSASDHAPVVADFTVPASTQTGIGDNRTEPAGPRFLASPNPFRAGTGIRFDLTATAAVRLDVYDLRGAQVRTLLDGGTLAAGGRSARWDGRDDAGRVAPAGIYFARLAVGGETPRTTRLLLLR